MPCVWVRMFNTEMTAVRKRRDSNLRLVALAFICGFALCACIVSFISVPTPTPVIQTVPVVAATQFQWSAPNRSVVELPRMMSGPASPDPLNLLPGTKRPRNVDLIDTRFQPQVPLE